MTQICNDTQFFHYASPFDPHYPKLGRAMHRLTSDAAATRILRGIGRDLRTFGGDGIAS